MNETAPNTWKRWVADTVLQIQVLTAFWGKRFVGGAMGLIADCISEGASQAIYARFPGHPQQAPDALKAVGDDRTLVRFRGETDDNWGARVRAAWDDFAQGGTPQQLIHAVNQWGVAGWPATWVDLTLANLDETSHVTPTNQFISELTIPYGGIIPPWTPEVYGG